MENQFQALPPEGEPTQNPSFFRPTDRLLLAGVLLFCFLMIDIMFSSQPWGAGLTAVIFLWYILLLADQGHRLFQSRESRILLGCNLALAVSFALTSNPWFRWWNLLALLALIPLHTCGLAGGIETPWHHPWMICERLELLLHGLLGNLGTALTVLSPKEKRWDRAWYWFLGGCISFALVSFLLPVLASADALFADAASRFFAFLRLYFAESLWKLAVAAMLTPFLFGLLYSLRKNWVPQPAPVLPSADGTPFMMVLAALDVLYLLFLLVQSAGLFGGPEYLEARGLSYAQWARSGFFQMTGVTALNLAAMLASVTFSKQRRSLRPLAAVLAAESLVLLASAAWRMTLYIYAYGLSFKRCMTYWGMGMMALFLLAALEKVWKPEHAFCRLALPLALAGWLLINCVPLDYLVAREQVERYLSQNSSVVSIDYLLYDLSYDTLSQLARLDGDTLCVVDGQQWAWLSNLLEQRQAEARRECADWRSWNLSACLAGRFRPAG